jgi:molybdate transport system substrate-binding protein
MMWKGALGFAVAALAALAPAGAVPDQLHAQHRELRVAAAASLSDVLPRVAEAFHARAHVDVRFNFAGSNTLARQIVEGARVDAFISADASQMDVVADAGRLVEGSRVDVLGNTLVIVVSDASLPIDGPDDLTRAGVRRLALGDPSAVPAGVYARRWLENVRVWSAVESKVVPLPSSPAALAAVAEGRAQAGIVYRTDVRNAAVRIAHVARAEDVPEIVYPAAAIAGGRALLAREFLAFLRSDAARAIFERAGFRALAPAE